MPLASASVRGDLNGNFLNKLNITSIDVNAIIKASISVRCMIFGIFL